jgi:hypothetical protein
MSKAEQVAATRPNKRLERTAEKRGPLNRSFGGREVTWAYSSVKIRYLTAS